MCKKRKYFVSTKQLRYLAKEGYRKGIRESAIKELKLRGFGAKKL